MGALSTLKRNGWLESRKWPDGAACSLMDRLFNRMDGTYPNRWRSAFANQAAIANWREAWAEAFEEEGMTAEEVKRGIVECRKRYDWPPSLAEFLKACRPPLDYEATYLEAVEQLRRRESDSDRWSNPAVYWAAAVKVGSFDLTTSRYDQIKGRWKRALDEAINEIQEGNLPNEVPKRRIALPAPGETTVSPEEAKRRLAEIVEKFGNATRIPDGDL